MNDPSKKKPYIKPEIYRVELSPDQAILTACSMGATNISAGANGTCRLQSGGCKQHNSASGDSGPRQS